jgi:hypothetical protein
MGFRGTKKLFHFGVIGYYSFRHTPGEGRSRHRFPSRYPIVRDAYKSSGRKWRLRDGFLEVGIQQCPLKGLIIVCNNFQGTNLVCKSFPGTSVVNQQQAIHNFVTVFF